MLIFNTGQMSPIVTGSRPSPRLPPTHFGRPNTFHSSGHHTTSEQQLGNVPVVRRNYVIHLFKV